MHGRQSCSVACVRTECGVIACLQMQRTQGIQLRTHRMRRTQIQRCMRVDATSQYLMQGKLLLMY